MNDTPVPLLSKPSSPVATAPLGMKGRDKLEHKEHTIRSFAEVADEAAARSAAGKPEKAAGARDLAPDRWERREIPEEPEKPEKRTEMTEMKELQATMATLSLTPAPAYIQALAQEAETAPAGPAAMPATETIQQEDLTPPHPFAHESPTGSIPPGIVHEEHSDGGVASDKWPIPPVMKEALLETALVLDAPGQGGQGDGVSALDVSLQDMYARMKALSTPVSLAGETAGAPAPDIAGGEPAAAYVAQQGNPAPPEAIAPEAAAPGGQASADDAVSQASYANRQGDTDTGTDTGTGTGTKDAAQPELRKPSDAPLHPKTRPIPAWDNQNNFFSLAQAIDGVGGALAPEGNDMASRIVQQIVDTTQSALSGNISQIRLQLNPEFLGRVSIMLTAGEDGLSARIQAQHSNVLDILASNLYKLESELRDLGINMKSIDITQLGMQGGMAPGEGRDGRFFRRNPESDGAGTTKPITMARFHQSARIHGGQAADLNLIGGYANPYEITRDTGVDFRA
ncbi:MAG: flagellar hook-length control protein FliK [Oscillospiraceae bacterium]|nr:flagellar hook-length control protein FliK [Oscillospiraceae bacterium]